MNRPVLRRALPLLLALLLALDLTVTFGMLERSDTLDLTFGKGGQRIVDRESGASDKARYYEKKYASAAETRAQAKELSRRIGDEGTVLLKNDGLLPLSPDTPVSPLGLGCFAPLYCGTGSSMISTLDKDVVSPVEGLRQFFPNVNEKAVSLQKNAYASGQGGGPLVVTARPLDGSGRTLSEFGVSVFEEPAALLSGSVGVVYIARRTGENEDACLSPYEDGTRHELALTAAEKALIGLAETHCSAVVAVIASASPMELGCLEDDPRVNAVLWQGGAGSTGYASIAGILAGAVEPSGRLPFTFAADFTKDPTYPNQDDGSDRFTYLNAFTTGMTHLETVENVRAAFHEYEEGVYLGYRYYETASDIGALENYYSRENGVVYPFGYGLSYTNFRQTIADISRNGDQTVLRVRVTNTGDRPGKDVVQVYFTAPYTDLDRQYAIEKPTVNLLSFAKTGVLAPGQSQFVEIPIDPESLASYCCTHPNGDGTTGCYMIEGGSYTISLRRDSHTVIDTFTITTPDTAWLGGTVARPSERRAQSPLDTGGSAVTQSARSGAYLPAVNRFEQLNTYMTDPSVSHAVTLTRADWTGTQPTAPADADRTASETVVGWIQEADVTKAAASDSSGGAAPVSGADNGLALIDLRGLAYDDPTWELLLDQLSYDDPEVFRTVLFEAAYKTEALSALQKPRSSEKDGPQGLTMADVSGRNWITGVCGYPAAPVMAATWNGELLYELGETVGQEALQKDIDGWYAPGLNLLRSPFCGRAAEYYSEDPLLAGRLGTRVVSGAGNNGLYCAAKHFCLMETEAHRSPNTCTWMTEQALRELYLRPFELVVKNARKTVLYPGGSDTGELSSRVMRAGDLLMASDSAVGAVWTAASPALLTDVVRREWGFQGAVISDIHMNASDAMLRRMLTAGCDLLMSIGSDKSVDLADYADSANRRLVRQAVKDLCYVQVNSALMQGISPGSTVEYGLSPWKKALLAVNCAVGVIVLGGAAYLCATARGKKRKA